MDEMKKCPSCAEDVQAAAVKCRYCGTILTSAGWQRTVLEWRSLSEGERKVYARNLSQEQFLMLQKLDAAIPRPTTPGTTWSPGIAAVLSLVIPGAGQMYKGQIGVGMAWLVCVILGYFLFIIPGLLLHLTCVITAASGHRA